MAFIKRPQPPFKAYVKTRSGRILKPNYKTALIEPAVFSKNGKPLFQFGWEITYDCKMFDKTGDYVGVITYSELIVETADTKEELE